MSSNRKEILQEIKKSIIKLMGEKDEVKLAEATTSSGQKIYTDAETWSDGVNVFMIDDQEQRVPLEPETYTLDNGSILVVETRGVVSSLTAPESTEELMKKKEEELAVANKEKEEMTVQLAGLKKTLEEKETEIKTLGVKLSEAEKQADEVVKLSAQVKSLTTIDYESILKLSAEQKRLELEAQMKDIPENKKALLNYRKSKQA